MNWRLLEYKADNGKFNMEYDLHLVNNVQSDVPILRFYGWTPYCISLGANQSFSDINTKLADAHGIDIVKRPTGGRAILHAEELTYSVVMPNVNNLSGKILYDDISNALVSGLRKFNSELANVELENINPNFKELLNNPSGSLCFASAAKSEIKFNGKKLVGSAQRKLGDTILQHGSILIGSYHKNLINYLNIDNKMKDMLYSEINNKTIEIENITNTPVDIHDLQECIISGFSEKFNTDFTVHPTELVVN